MLERTPKTCYDLSEPDFQDAVRLSSDLLEDPTTRSRLVSGSRIGLAIEFDTVGLFFSPRLRQASFGLSTIPRFTARIFKTA